MSENFRRLFVLARHALNDQTLAICILVAVAVTCVFGFLLGASAELVCGMLTLGVFTAVAESRIRHRMKE